MLAYLRRHHADCCRGWFEELEPLWLNGGVLKIRANNQIQKNYLHGRCRAVFNEAAQAVTEALVTVQFVDSAADTPPADHAERNRRSGGSDNGSTRAAGPGRADHRDDPFDDAEDQILLSPDYAFEHFVTGPGNRFAHAAAVAVAQSPGQSYNPLFIHGGVGLGKTHLLQATCQTVLQANPRAKICYMSCDTFVNQFMDAVQSGQMHGFRHRYRHVDLLVIDDIHFLAKRDRTQEEFFHTFNTLFQQKKQIVLSSDSPPHEIPELEERLISRFSWGLVTMIEKPCYETRVAIVRKKAEIRDLKVPDDVVCYIAAQIESNTRELEGALTKVCSMANLTEQPLTLDLARRALGDERAAAVGPQTSIQTINDAVTQFYSVKLSDLQSKRRHRSITVPRQLCMYLARRHTGYSLEEIGGYYGGRDHTTVMHAIRSVEERLGQDQRFAGQVQSLDEQLRNGHG